MLLLLLLTRLTHDDLLMRSKHVLEMTATCSICNTAAAKDTARRQTPPPQLAAPWAQLTPRVVAAAALNSVVVFPENVSLRLRPTCLPLTILAAAISLTKIPEGLRCSFRSALVFPPPCENFRAVIGAGLSNDLAPPSQKYRYLMYLQLSILYKQLINILREINNSLHQVWDGSSCKACKR